MKNLYYLTLACVVCGIFASSCVTTNSQSSSLEKLPSQIQKGVSTKSDVLRLYGEPDRKEITSSAEIWSYGGGTKNKLGSELGRQAVGVGLSQIPYAGNVIAVARAAGAGPQKKPKASAAKVIFSRTGVVRDYSLYLQ